MGAGRNPAALGLLFTWTRGTLVEFKMISSLECNVEKTTLMQIGSNDPVSREVVDLGFDIQDEVKLLGLKIKKTVNTIWKV